MHNPADPPPRRAPVRAHAAAGFPHPPDTQMKFDDVRDVFFQRHPDPMWVFEPGTLRFLEVNDAAVRRYGWTREEFLAMTIADIRPREEVPKLLAQVHGFDGTQVGPARWVHMRKSGEILHVDIVSHLVEYAGRPAELVAARDVSQVVELDARLGETTGLLRFARAVAKLGAWRVPLPHGPTEWSEETAAIHELPGVRTMPIERAIQFYAPEFRDRIRAVFDRCARDGVPYDELMQILTASGRRVWVRTLGEPVRDSQGRIVAVHGAFQDVSELMAAREREADANRRLASMVENISDSVMTLDSARRITYVNGHAEEVLGCTRGELLGRVVWEAFPVAVDTVFQRELEQAFATRAPAKFAAYSEPFGKWFDVAAYPFPEGLAIYFRDSTREHVRDEQLRLLESAAARVSDVLLITDAEPADGPDGPRIVYVNDAFVRLTGYAREEALGGSLRMLHGPRTDAAELARMRESLRAWLPVRTELVNYKKSGEEFWAELEIVPLADEGGRYTHRVAVLRDVTARRRSEEALRLSDERFHLVARATNDVVWDWDVESDRLWWSESLLDVFGYDPARIEPGVEAWRKRIHPEDRERVLARQEAIIRGGSETFTSEYRFLRGDGRVAIVMDRGFAIRGADGRALRMIGCVSDVTERRELDARLRESQKLEAVGQLTGGVAHDFNNLLTVMLGSAELLAHHLEDRPALRKLADMIVLTAGRGADLTKRLLAFARRQALDPRVIDVGELAAGMDSLLRRVLAENVHVQVVRATDLWRAEVDPGQLEVALLNLAINARDAMPDGGCITIECANVRRETTPAAPGPNGLAAGEYVSVVVSDTGSGMTADVLERAFEPFFTTKDVGKGTGLGLSMVYGFVKQSGGHATIESQPGRGTTVRLYFPRAATREASVPEPIAAASRGGHEHVLVVEDEALVREHAATVLRELGYRVTTAANGTQALALLGATADVDLLFTDVVMPGSMNGRQLADAARALRPSVRVLYTSGYAEDVLGADGRAERGVPIVVKPYRREELAAKVRSALDGVRAGRTAGLTSG